MKRWMAPTMKDALGLEGNPSARCGCGRTTTADMMVDVRALDDVAGDFICDACRSRLFRQGLDRAEFARRLGAPSEVVERVARRRRSRPPR